MTTNKQIFVTSHVILAALFSMTIRAQDRNIVGTWKGELSTSGIELSIVFHFNKDAQGNLTGTMDSPDQGAYGIGVDNIVVTRDHLELSVPSVFGGYKGNFVDDEHIEGDWSQGGGKIPLDLAYSSEIVAINRPQEPKPPFPYEVRDVLFQNHEAEIQLAGTLTIPEGEGPFPGLVLVSGSGPQDRNEEIYGHKPFWVLADRLARNNIAVLRYDDRGIGESGGSFGTSTTADFADDAQSAVRFLMDHAKVNPEKVGIVGHSEGGLIAAMIAATVPDIDFIVLLAGPGLGGEEILALQGRLIAGQGGEDAAMIEKGIAFQQRAIQIIKNETDPDKAIKELGKLVEEYWKKLSDEEKEDPQNSKRALMSGMVQLNGPWFRYFLTYDPSGALEQVKCPVLAINGEKDLQVPPAENLAAIEMALKNGGNSQYKIVALEGLNHLFQTSETGHPSEYGKIEETISGKVLELITEWITAVTSEN